MKKSILFPCGLCLVVYFLGSLFLMVNYPFYLHRWLLWNVFLAALPLLFALLLRIKKQPAWVRVLWGILWLAFFPNAPYVITDLIHVVNMSIFSPASGLARDIYPWVTLLHLGIGVLLANMLGFCSLRIIEEELRALVGKGWAICAVLLACLASGYGIYIGRFARVNSWDILNPSVLFGRIAEVTDGQGLLLSLCFAGYILAGYAVFRAFRRV